MARLMSGLQHDIGLGMHMSRAAYPDQWPPNLNGTQYTILRKLLILDHYPFSFFLFPIHLLQPLI